MLGLDLAVDGPSQLQAYWLRELPRISEHGEGGSREMSLPRAAFGPVLRGVEPGRTVMDGRSYSATYFHFVLNGALVPGDARGADSPFGPWPRAGPRPTCRI